MSISNVSPRMEIRTYTVEWRVAQAEGDSAPSIEGYASVFNQASEDLGGFTEVVHPGAFAKTIKEADIRALFNHDPNYVLGRNVANTLTLKEDIHGLRVSITPPNTTWANDLQVSMKRGDVSQMSFAFDTIKDDWHVDQEGNVTRGLYEVRLYDVSVVTYPAYPQTIAEARAKAVELRTKAEPGKDAHSADTSANFQQELETMLMLVDVESEVSV